MTIFARPLAVCGLVALTLGTLSSAPAGAQGFHYPVPARRAQMRQAARLDRQAAHAAFNGNHRAARRLRTEAARLRAAARHGY